MSRATAGHGEVPGDLEEDPAMTDPDREHPQEPAEGAERPGEAADERTPHPEQPAEGDPGIGSGGADTPGT